MCMICEDRNERCEACYEAWRYEGADEDYLCPRCEEEYAKEYDKNPWLNLPPGEPSPQDF